MPAPLDTAGPIPLPPRNSWTSMADTKKIVVFMRPILVRLQEQSRNTWLGERCFKKMKQLCSSRLAAKILIFDPFLSAKRGQLKRKKKTIMAASCRLSN